MRKDPNFYRRLYRGFHAEHLVTGRLSELEWEAHRLSADFGFDLAVSNKLQQTYRGARKISFTIQVKSRRTNWIEDGPNDRPRAQTKFYLGADEVQKMMNAPDDFYVFVIFAPPDNRALNSFFNIFWVSSLQIQTLMDRCFLLWSKSSQRWVMEVEWNFLPMDNRDRFIQSLGNQITDEARRKMEKRLPSRWVRNWDAKHYISLLRPAYYDRNIDHGFVARRVPYEMCDLKGMCTIAETGMQPPLGSLMS